ncbi:ABC transporter permease [Tepidibacillus fermentans]|uniref:Peptide/nickel transport system permease protein/oligopeptide transport system permease protein n=1 Tax=Tepidibacillus fermentans TaxID=1281767 RepID=A0A4R3KJT0_9BACI|nr:ABC transporter permease [Tepidibacillus fermentans]TCS83572.1 peptide/nickel transport system permease protein/oligopeptide transport system permease protein [Tepidibacillus fermentans]
MLRYVLQRLTMLLVTLWVVITLTFILMHAIPGDPFTSEKKLPESTIQNLKAFYGLDKPLPVQYVNYLKNIVVHQDFGPSFKSKTLTVNDYIANNFPVSAQLGIQSLLIALVFGLTLGVIASLRHNTALDYTAMIIAVLGVSVPNIVLAPILINIFAVKLKWFPIAMWGTFAHTVLPSIALGAHSMAVIARLMRSNMLEVLNQDYIRTARSKGLSSFVVVWRHTIRNAILPVITILGPLAATLLTGTFVVEQIFGIPGLGKYFVQSVSDRDYPMILGTTIFYSAILITANFLVDIAYGLIDPRIKIGAKGE